MIGLVVGECVTAGLARAGHPQSRVHAVAAERFQHGQRIGMAFQARAAPRQQQQRAVAQRRTG